MSAKSHRPRGLGRAGGKLWDEITGAVADGWKLDGRDEALLTRACRLADVEADLRTDVTRHGRMVTGSTGQLVVNPALKEARMTAATVAQIVAKVEIRPPRARTGHLSKAQRDQLGDARARRWPRAGS